MKDASCKEHKDKNEICLIQISDNIEKEVQSQEVKAIASYNDKNELVSIEFYEGIPKKITQKYIDKNPEMWINKDTERNFIDYEIKRAKQEVFDDIETNCMNPEKSKFDRLAYEDIKAKHLKQEVENESKRKD